MRASSTLIIALLCLCLSSSLTPRCRAADSLSGLTGILATPSAELFKPKEYSFGAYKIGDDNWWNFGYGFAERVEGSILRIETPDEKTVLWNVKLNLFKQTAIVPAVSVGLLDITNSEETTFYVVLSKNLYMPFKALPWLSVKGHIGVGSAKLLDGLFGGIEIQTTLRYALLFEYINTHLNGEFSISPSSKLPVKIRFITFEGELGIGFSYYVELG